MEQEVATMLMGQPVKLFDVDRSQHGIPAVLQGVRGDKVEVKPIGHRRTEIVPIENIQVWKSRTRPQVLQEIEAWRAGQIPKRETEVSEPDAVTKNVVEIPIQFDGSECSLSADEKDEKATSVTQVTFYIVDETSLSAWDGVRFTKDFAESLIFRNETEAQTETGRLQTIYPKASLKALNEEAALNVITNPNSKPGKLPRRVRARHAQGKPDLLETVDSKLMAAKDRYIFELKEIRQVVLDRIRDIDAQISRLSKSK